MRKRKSNDADDAANVVSSADTSTDPSIDEESQDDGVGTPAKKAKSPKSNAIGKGNVYVSLFMHHMMMMNDNYI